LQKGINTDLSADGKNYHVQTEDWGIKNPYLVTRIYRNGAVLKTIKLPYQRVLEGKEQDFQETIRLAMKEQHYEILDLIHSGQIK